MPNHRAGRGWHRHRQDAQLSGPGNRSGPERSGGTVWISTYTKALQRQLDPRDAPPLSNDAAFRKHGWISRRAGKIISACSIWRMRCRAALPDARRSSHNSWRAGRPMSRDGDMVGGDLPGWLPGSVPPCGRDRADRPARRVHLCRLPALSGPASSSVQRAPVQRRRHRHRQSCACDDQCRARTRSDKAQPTRIVFDEGHHLFDAADSTFGAALTGPGSDRAAALDHRTGNRTARASARSRRAPLRCRQRCRRCEAIDDAREAAVNCRATTGCAAWSNMARLAPSRNCSPPSAPPSMPVPS